MKPPEHPLHLVRIAFKRDDSASTRNALRALDYRLWREREIIRLELQMTRSVVSRARLLRAHRTVHIETLLLANERHMLRLGSALAALTRIPFTLLDVLNTAAAAAQSPLILA